MPYVFCRLARTCPGTALSIIAARSASVHLLKVRWCSACCWKRKGWCLMPKAGWIWRSTAGRGQQQQPLYAPLGAGETACKGLFRRLQQMEMRRAASPGPWIGPVRDDFRIGHDLVIQQEQGHIGELLEQVIANLPGQALPFVGIHGLRQLHVALVDEGILKMMHRAFTRIRDPNPFFGRPQTNNIGPDAPGGLLVPPHTTDFPLIEGLDA